MSIPEDRRKFLAHSALATAGILAAGFARGQEPPPGPTLGKVEVPPAEKNAQQEDIKPETAKQESAKPDGPYPRFHPGLGGPIGSPSDRGKLVSGLREGGLEPVEVIAPDLQKAPWKMVNNAKEFELRAMPVRRELLPGIWMNAYGYNDLFPGPVVEVTQGDRVRIVLKNELPEETTLHSHGMELPISMDGIPGVTQPLIKPGESFVYEFDLHQEGSYFFHPHVAMQEALGMVVPFFIHPKVAHDPVVDRDFVLVTQQFFMRPNSTVADTLSMDWNFLTINGRSGPYTTPLVCKLGERVRIRFINFSTLHQHPMHLHGHTFWVTGTEGGRIPESAWIPGNNVVVGVAQSRDVEFIANNPGDWVLHCHMFHHMMNHMVSQVGPIIRQKMPDPGRHVPGYPQIMQGMSNMNMKMDDIKHENMKDMPSHEGMKMDPAAGQNEYQMKMTMEEMHKITDRRETAGMREGWHMGVKGLFTVLRVLPPDLFHKVMDTTDPVPPNSSTPLMPHQHH